MKNFGFKDKEEVLDFLEKNKIVKFVRIIFPDVLGREMSFCVPSEEMKSAFENGAGFDGSSVEGFARVEESDLVIMPEAKTFRVLPWNYMVQETAWKEAIVFGNIFTSDQKHFESDSRYILKKILDNDKDFGQLFVGPELEFFIFENPNHPQLLDHGGYFYGGRWGEVRKAAQIYLRKMGIEAECDHHEVSPSQHEIVLKYQSALDMADSIMITKYVVKRVARKLGLFASFMPKPITKINGSGMHLHLSLWEGKQNLFFWDKNDPLSSLAKQYVMGLIKYGREIQLILNQWVNSYKRLIPGYEAPVYLAWGRKNRSAYIRVPEIYSQEGEKSTRIEIRSPDPACNIYLSLAIVQAAGTQGIKEDLELVSPQEKNIFKMKESAIEKKKIKVLSKNLKEALGIFKGSDLVKNVIGQHFFQKIIKNKEIEWERYQKVAEEEFEEKVSPYEIKEYFPVL